MFAMLKYDNPPGNVDNMYIDHKFENTHIPVMMMSFICSCRNKK